MPRLPVDGDKVIEHRITLGTKERELLDGATFAYTANRWLTPILNALGDPVFLLVLVGAVGLAVDRLLPGIDWRTITQDMTPDQVHDWLETQNIVGGAIGSVIGGILGLGIGAPWFGAAVGGVAGNVVVEGGEWVIEETGEVLGEAASQNPSLFTYILIQIANSYSALGLTNGGETA